MRGVLQQLRTEQTTWDVPGVKPIFTLQERLLVLICSCLCKLLQLLVLLCTKSNEFPAGNELQTCDKRMD